MGSPSAARAETPAPSGSSQTGSARGGTTSTATGTTTPRRRSNSRDQEQRREPKTELKDGVPLRLFLESSQIVLFLEFGGFPHVLRRPQLRPPLSPPPFLTPRSSE